MFGSGVVESAIFGSGVVGLGVDGSVVVGSGVVISGVSGTVVRSGGNGPPTSEHCCMLQFSSSRSNLEHRKDQHVPNRTRTPSSHVAVQSLQPK